MFIVHEHLHLYMYVRENENCSIFKAHRGKIIRAERMMRVRFFFLCKSIFSQMTVCMWCFQSMPITFSTVFMQNEGNNFGFSVPLFRPFYVSQHPFTSILYFSISFSLKLYRGNKHSTHTHFSILVDCSFLHFYLHLNFCSFNLTIYASPFTF